MKWRVWIEPRKGKFIVRTRNSQGQNGKSQTCSTKWIANKVRDRLETELELSGLGIQDPHKSVHSMWEEYRNELERAGQIEYMRTMQCVVPRFIADKKIGSDMTQASVQSFRTTLINSMATATVKSRLRHLSAWLEWCRKKKYIERSPFYDIEIPDYVPQPKFMTEEQMRKIEAITTGELKLAWRIAITTGLRQGNIRNLCGEMIEGDVAIIPRTKGKKPIIAPLEKEVLELLPRPLPQGPLFPRYSGGIQGRWAIQRDFKRIRKAAGLGNDVKWHGSRHTFVKDALQAGLTTFEVMGYTGHISPISMKPYAHFETQRLRERHRLIRQHRMKKIASGQEVGSGGQNLELSESKRNAVKWRVSTVKSKTGKLSTRS